MKKHHTANVLLITIVLLSVILSTLFISKRDVIHTENLKQYFYKEYLLDRFILYNKISNNILNEDEYCNIQKNEKIKIKQKMVTYSFICQKFSIFKKEKPSKEKYILVDNIENWLNIKEYNEKIISISELAEIPITSMDSPKIVRFLNDIEGRLEKDFYGIIITDNYFKFSGKKIYGVIYSSYNNVINERNVSFKKEVINHIDNEYSYWKIIENSRSLLDND